MRRTSRAFALGAATVAVWATTNAACIPEYGQPADAGSDRPRPPDAAPGTGGGPGSDAASATDVIATVCDPVTVTLDIEGIGSTYVPDRVTVPAGACVRFCASSLGGERHTHSSDEGLFPNYTTSPGNAPECKIFSRSITMGTYGITCLEHRNTMRLVIVAE